MMHLASLASVPVEHREQSLEQLRQALLEAGKLTGSPIEADITALQELATGIAALDTSSTPEEWQRIAERFIDTLYSIGRHHRFQQRIVEPLSVTT